MFAIKKQSVFIKKNIFGTLQCNSNSSILKSYIKLA
jgi:hypothetical protein